jgi:hypothetical protein
MEKCVQKKIDRAGVVRDVRLSDLSGVTEKGVSFSINCMMVTEESHVSRYKLVSVSIFFMVTTAWAASCAVSIGAAFVGARAREAKIHSPYPDSTQGLKQELKDMLEMARQHRPDQLRAMVTDLEIPNARAWYLANLGASGLESANNYEKYLTASKERLKNQMMEFAREDGYFSVKKQDAKKVYPSLITAPEVFLAAWKTRSALGKDPSETPFGYFLFVDGKFRWDSTIMWVTVD